MAANRGSSRITFFQELHFFQIDRDLQFRRSVEQIVENDGGIESHHLRRIESQPAEHVLEQLDIGQHGNRQRDERVAVKGR